MIKRCPVLLNNAAVTVVKYDDTDVQLPAVGRDMKYLEVDFTDGKYEIVDGKQKKVVEKAADKKIENKKTTIGTTPKIQVKKSLEKKNEA